MVCLVSEFLEFSEFLELGDCVLNFVFFGMFGIGRLGV